MLQQLRHICFDKDGTLTDAHVYWADITRRRVCKLIQYYVLPELCGDALAHAMGIDLSRKKIIPGGPVGYKPRNVVVAAAQEALKRLGVEAEILQISDLFGAVDKDIQEKNDYCLKLFKNVPEVLGQLRSLGLKISIYTSDRVNSLLNILKQLELEKCIDSVVGGDEVEKSKPNADGFQKACERLGVSIAHSVYVGDTLDDMRMANSCGSLGGFGVTTGLSSREELLTLTDFVFDDLVCMSEYLGNLRNTHV